MNTYTFDYPRKKITDISLINNVYTKKIMYFCILKV